MFSSLLHIPKIWEFSPLFIFSLPICFKSLILSSLDNFLFKLLIELLAFSVRLKQWQCSSELLQPLYLGDDAISLLVPQWGRRICFKKSMYNRGPSSFKYCYYINNQISHFLLLFCLLLHFFSLFYNFGSISNFFCIFPNNFLGKYLTNKEWWFLEK